MIRESITAELNPEYSIGCCTFTECASARYQAEAIVAETGHAQIRAKYPDGGGYIVDYKTNEYGMIEVNYLPRDWEV